MNFCLCINPQCSQSNNTYNSMQCDNCGSDLLLEGQYKAIKLLNDNSGFGNIFEIKDISEESFKVLKVLKKNDPESITRFKREFETLTELNHEGICKAEDYFSFSIAQSKEEIHCIVMEKIDGTNLEEWLQNRNNKPITEKLAITWLKQIANILHEIHQNNFFHRDIKPSNIMLKGDGKLTLIDFGTARKVDDLYQQELNTGKITKIHTEGYAPIEQELGKATPQSDFCALGRTFVFLLTGKHPDQTTQNYRSPNTDDDWDWRSETSNVSEVFLDFIDILMSRSPTKRPTNTQEILDRIKDELYYNLPTKLSSNQNNSSTQQQFQFVQNLGDISSRHSTPIYSIGISPNGSWLISGSQGGSAKIWSLKSNQVIYDLQAHSQTVTSVDISPSGNVFATGSIDYKNYAIKLWSFENNDELDISILRQIKTSAYVVDTICFHPNGKNLISGDRASEINIWDLENGNSINTLKNHSKPISSIVTTKDAQKLISASHDLKIVVDAEFILESHKTPVHSLAVSPDNKTLFSGSNEGEIKVWNLDTGELIDTLTKHEDAVLSLVLSPNGKTLFSGSKDKTIKIWNIDQLEVTETLKRHTDAITSLVVSPDGMKLYSASLDKSIKLWQIYEKENM